MIKYIGLFFIFFKIAAQSVDDKWLNRQVAQMSLDEKIGQLFMVAANGDGDSEQHAKLLRFVTQNHIGGVCFFKGEADLQLALTQMLQKQSKTPLLIGIDGEWGLAMRLKKTFKYPWNMTLGASADDALVEAMGRQLGKHCKRMGIHINFAPVVDVNNNAENPIIGNRSFGESPKNVVRKSRAFIRGIHRENVMVSAKHFPGHGDTATDSHKNLPYLPFKRSRLEKVELYPYRQLLKDGHLDAVMVGHLNVPTLTKGKMPASLSYEVCTNLLQKELGFKGLIITDGLNMSGVYQNKDSTMVALKAFKAGNDILLIPKSFEKSFDHIKKAVQDGSIVEERLNHSVKKILKAKKKLGLWQQKVPLIKGLYQDLNTPKDEVLKMKLMKSAITLVKNRRAVLPIEDLSKARIAYVKVGDDVGTTFLETLRLYHKIILFDEKEGLKSMLNHLKKSRINKVIIGYHRSDAHPWKSFKMSANQKRLIMGLSRKYHTILSVFASPYSLASCDLMAKTHAVLVAYQNNQEAQKLTAQMIFGALVPKGKLPVSIGDCYPVGHGLSFAHLSRLSYVLPAMAQLSADKLKRIDTILNDIVRRKMTPGGQVLIARHGQVVYHKSFGYHTYDSLKKVHNTDLYDLASLTKILSGFPLLLYAKDKGKLKMNATFSDLFPKLRGTDKDTLTLKALLSHRSGLKDWFPYYKKTLDSLTQKPLKKYYRSTPSRKYPIFVANGMYLHRSFKDTIYQNILDSPLDSVVTYRYSDLFFTLLPRYLKHALRKDVNVLLERYFTKPMGNSNLTYLPNTKDLSVTPSEEDNYFRYQRIQGTVHDMAAAMLGGVSTHAGLFGNANSVAKMMQLYLQKGFYGGRRYFKNSTFNLFNHAYYAGEGIRRGLVLDKPSVTGEETNTCNCVSMDSFGHSGFTGTFAWADSKTGLLYVFLSNRTFPSMENNDLFEYDIRTKIQQLVVDAME